MRDLTRRQQDKGVSLGEKNLLRDARSPLVAECAIVLMQSTEETEAVIDAAILHGTARVLRGLATAV